MGHDLDDDELKATMKRLNKNRINMEIDIQEIEEIKKHVVDGIVYDYKPTDIGDKTNELIKAVKQLDKQIKEK